MISRITSLQYVPPQLVELELCDDHDDDHVDPKSTGSHDPKMINKTHLPHWRATLARQASLTTHGPSIWHRLMWHPFSIAASCFPVRSQLVGRVIFVINNVVT